VRFFEAGQLASPPSEAAFDVLGLRVTYAVLI
jgi:hypothetical protein